MFFRCNRVINSVLYLTEDKAKLLVNLLVCKASFT
jgi:hypothetical protein